MFKNHLARLLHLALLLILAVNLSGCERPATISNWRPIDTDRALTSSPSSVSTRPPSSSTAESTLTALPPLPTPSALPSSLPKSLKGYELYSWQNGGDWNFTLITGTNRSKSFDEIIAPENTLSADGFVKISVTGIDEIKKVLSLLQGGEQVFWAGMDLSDQVPGNTIYLTFPPQSVIDDLTRFCQQHKVTLQILKEP